VNPRVVLATPVRPFVPPKDRNPLWRAAQIIATSCLFLAGKVEETPKALNEVISKTYVIRHEREGKEVAMERIKRKVCYLTLRSSMVPKTIVKPIPDI
jgi:hypothetical protein